MTTFPLRILLLNFTEQAGQTIRYYAREEGWSVEEKSMQHNYLHKIKANEYALILLHISPTTKDGFKQCLEIRRAFTEKTALLLLTEGGIMERLAGFQAGADDCVSKPFSMRELLYRMRVLIERAGGHSRQPVNVAFRSRLLSTKLELE
ncbi:MAG: DNA-binding response regulator, partial [Paenibacillus sp.]|nr:DNA-binding response regulator [Paenibacillus sp.]